MHQARHRTGESSWRIRPRSLAALAVATAGLVAAIWLPGVGGVASAAEQKPAFADDFNQAHGTGLDLTKWSIDGDTEAGVEDGDGDLVVTRMLTTRQTFDEPFGHAEARIEVNRASGAWRAFGVLDKYGRIIPGRLQTLRGGFDPTDGGEFHLYAIDWSPTAIVWSVDGKPTLRLLPSGPVEGIQLVLNLATDGRRAVRMVVDFVHVSVWEIDPSATPSTSPSESSSPSASPSPSASASSAAVAEWAPFTNYAAGDLVTYEGATYKVLEAHTSLPGWEPPALPNLFQKL